MTKQQAETALETGSRVIAEAGEDTDTGYILELTEESSTGRTMACVGWDNCSQSECDISSLKLASASAPRR